MGWILSASPSPEERYMRSDALVTQNAVWFGKEGHGRCDQLRWGEVIEEKSGLKSSVIRVLIRRFPREGRHTQRGSHAITEAQTGSRSFERENTEPGSNCQEAGRRKEGFPYTFQRGPGPTGTLVSDFQPPELWEDMLLLFAAIQFVELCEDNLRKWIQCIRHSGKRELPNDAVLLYISG